ncbi:unnamed protein product [Mytilus coruscus]|uniref:Integrase catalytic domain-containing protein n=1 Tax=Mytilus coruscus TaxID=42192 RepID=A0A6J8ED26_MYTCO|nr:unnamed protein product [Mytilus coruscus]
MVLVEANGPMERIATDILGELPETEDGNKYILVVSDYYTKWTESFAMPNIEAKTVAKIIVEEVIVRFGVPHWIHSDQGRQFESLLFQEMCCIPNIKKTRTTPYHPKSDGMVERFNKTLATMLSSFVEQNQRNWDEYIPFVMMAYRASEHETTGQTPKSHVRYRGKPQVIHVDRLKKKNKQTLRTESDNNTFVPLDTENDTAENDPIETPYFQDIAVNESTLPAEGTEESSVEERRTRRKPVWMNDYIVK